MHYLVNKIEVPKDLETAFLIRTQVFVVEQGVDPDLERDSYDTQAIHFLAWEGSRAGGTARMRTTEKGIKLERFAILSEYRGKGLGKVLCQYMLKYIDSGKIQDLKPEFKIPRVYLNAQVQVIPFYEKLGFIVIGEPFQEAGIWHRKMVKAN
jgi:predicted GNAT family N-acyltransferase